MLATCISAWQTRIRTRNDMVNPKPISLLKPTVETPFHIDFDWWRQNDNDWHVFVRSLLCPEHQETFKDWGSSQPIDWIDPQTAEVREIDGLQHILIEHCAREESFLPEHTALVDAIFRILLVNGNSPMTCVQFAGRLKRPADTILRTISGPRIYKGIRPVFG